jgi:hypothetical protein
LFATVTAPSVGPGPAAPLRLPVPLARAGPESDWDAQWPPRRRRQCAPPLRLPVELAPAACH